jgi:hypothetical protein
VQLEPKELPDRRDVATGGSPDKEWAMKTSVWLSSAIGAAALGVLTLPVQAAPVGSLTGNAVAARDVGANTDQVHYRCWWHHGHRHCRYARYGYYGYGYGPSVGIYVGPRWRHHHRRW